MADYTTRTLAEKLLPARTEENPKAATRELRKFLRDTLGDGKAVVGKGQRYSLTYNAKELAALKKKFSAWQVEQAEAQRARREALAAKITATPAPIIDEAPSTDEEPEPSDEDLTLEGPTDEEIVQMLDDSDDED